MTTTEHAPDPAIPATMHRRLTMRTVDADHIVFVVRVPRPRPPKPPAEPAKADRVLTAGVWVSLAWSLASFGTLLTYVNPLIHFWLAAPALTVLALLATVMRRRAVPVAAIAGLVILAAASTI